MSQSVQNYEDEQYHIHWNGLIFLPGFEEGRPSVAEITAKLKTDCIESISNELMGSYFLYIYIKELKRGYAIVDNSRMYNAYYTNKHIFSNFRELLCSRDIDRSNVDEKNLYEYIRIGNTLGEKTIFSNVYNIGSQDILKIENNTIEKIRKNVRKRTGTIEEIFSDISYAIGSRNIEIDLTGGIDSRLLVLLALRSGLNFSTSVIGNEGSKDITVSEEIAKRLGISHSIYNENNIPAEIDIDSLLDFSDNLFNITDNFRSFLIQQERIKAGKNLVLTGVGGELYKEFFMQQEFPGYRPHSTDFRKVFALRFDRKIQNDIFTHRIRKYERKFIGTQSRRLNKYKKQNTTNTLCTLWSRHKIPNLAGLGNTGSINTVIDVYSPFMERKLIDLFSAIRMEERLMDYWVRKYMSKLDREIALIHTAEGMSISSGIIPLVIDARTYVKQKTARITGNMRRNRMSRKGAQSFTSAVNSAIIKSEKFETYLDILKKENIILPETRTEEIDNAIIGSVFTLGSIFSKIINNKYDMKNM